MGWGFSETFILQQDLGSFFKMAKIMIKQRNLQLAMNLTVASTAGSGDAGAYKSLMTSLLESEEEERNDIDRLMGRGL